ncbi:MAG: pilus assembly protein [Acidimicrobiales bacterium]|nr:pilus assembly protein [Acidimicrobiales bacterium]
MTPGAPAGGPRRRDDDGAATTEMVLVMPVLIAFLSLVVVAGRLTDAKSDVVSAASDAARAASLQANAQAAQAQAQAIAEDSVAGEGIECVGGIRVVLSYPGGGGFARGATVQATVSCDVQTGDLALLDLPGVVTVTERAWEPVDTHRSL